METNAITIQKTQDLTPAQTIKLRNAAKQFEAVLLQQLTSVLNDVGSDEDSLFGTDGGTDLAKKLFSEQMATAMSESGGIGLGDTILREFGLEPEPRPTRSRSISSSVPETSIPFQKSEMLPLVNNSGKVRPVIDAAANGDSFEIVSKDAPSVDDDSWRNAFIAPEYGIDYTNAENQTSAPVPTGNYTMPVQGRISSRYGSRFHPIDKQLKFHGGIDIAAPRGTPISSAGDGVVVFAGKKGGYGNMVIIEHPDGRTTRYAHADKLFVTEGQKVSAGEKIATVGSTGKATGPHLHFEVRENGEAVNPFEVFSNVSLTRTDK